MQRTHIGIYGVLEKEGRLLLVRKSRGPYKGLLDFPGGKLEHGETLFGALQREVKEETNVHIKEIALLGNFSFLVDEFYHIALLYLVKKWDDTHYRASIAAEDVEGSLFVPLASLNDVTPLVQCYLSHRENSQ